jgi:hypothetical protein
MPPAATRSTMSSPEVTTPKTVYDALSVESR